MKSQTGPAQHRIPPQVTPFDDSEHLDEPYEFQDTSAYHTVNVSHLIKSGRTALRDLRSTTNTNAHNTSYKLDFEGTQKGERFKQHTSKGSLQEDFENIDPTELAYRLKVQVHQLKKKEASHRLEISRLGKSVIELQEENAMLRGTIKSLEVRGSKDNEYVLRLDAEVRAAREELDKLKKQSKNSSIGQFEE